MHTGDHGVQRDHSGTFPIADGSPGAQYNAILVESKFSTSLMLPRCCQCIAVAHSNCDHN